MCIFSMRVLTNLRVASQSKSLCQLSCVDANGYFYLMLVGLEAAA